MPYRVLVAVRVLSDSHQVSDLYRRTRTTRCPVLLHYKRVADVTCWDIIRSLWLLRYRCERAAVWHPFSVHMMCCAPARRMGLTFSNGASASEFGCRGNAAVDRQSWVTPDPHPSHAELSRSRNGPDLIRECPPPPWYASSCQVEVRD